MKRLIKAYLYGMRMFGETAPWSAVIDEWKEFIEEPSVEEFFDVLHGLLSMVWRPLGLLAWPTARKHAKRVIEYGCPRSLRNHNAAGEECCCKTKRRNA
jgi:hypothetical protein|tara:strand:+ start:581 stop:877 length:297 start_codon:yes stop_codon:yes gene_type:complete